MVNENIKVSFYKNIYREFTKQQMELTENDEYRLKFVKGYNENTPSQLLTLKHSQFLDFIEHCEDGPAYYVHSLALGTGHFSYMFHGRFHRLDGPAVIMGNGLRKWYVNGNLIDNDIIDNWFEINDIDETNMSPEHKLHLKLFLQSYG